MGVFPLLLVVADVLGRARPTVQCVGADIRAPSPAPVPAVQQEAAAVRACAELVELVVKHGRRRLALQRLRHAPQRRQMGRRTVAVRRVVDGQHDAVEEAELAIALNGVRQQDPFQEAADVVRNIHPRILLPRRASVVSTQRLVLSRPQLSSARSEWSSVGLSCRQHTASGPQSASVVVSTERLVLSRPQLSSAHSEWSSVGLSCRQHSASGPQSASVVVSTERVVLSRPQLSSARSEWSSVGPVYCHFLESHSSVKFCKRNIKRHRSSSNSKRKQRTENKLVALCRDESR